jgi:hypothetical protein
MFKTKRHLLKIQDHYKSNNKSTQFQQLEQRYEVNMFVNHAMTHMAHMIDDFDEIELSRGMENSASGLKVINPSQERWQVVRQLVEEKFKCINLS